MGCLAEDVGYIRYVLAGSAADTVARYDREHHENPFAYADDLLRPPAVLPHLHQGLQNPPILYIGHPVGAMIGIIAAIDRPQRFQALFLIGASFCYLRVPDRTEGRTPADRILCGAKRKGRNRLVWL
ncbi:alpha/beta hydrolase [Acidithiobacillus sp.]|uniref:alpha/beta hydrolase n=1 Tax=Acidithiobacillus sp. TaxID=1872118 RepID=UPI0025BC6C43|nr:alpha/beta hydrolase [Acidithiobacillus sp.]